MSDKLQQAEKFYVEGFSGAARTLYMEIIHEQRAQLLHTNADLSRVKAHTESQDARIEALVAECARHGARVPKSYVVLSGAALKEAYEMVCPDGGANPEQLEDELVIEHRAAWVATDGEAMPAGYYAYFIECPEEGCTGPLGEPIATPATAPPMGDKGCVICGGPHHE